MTSSGVDFDHEELRDRYHESVNTCFEQTPEWHGKILRPKPPFNRDIHRVQTPMSFSRTLIDIAGGMRNLREHWEFDE